MVRGRVRVGVVGAVRQGSGKLRGQAVAWAHLALEVDDLLELVDGAVHLDDVDRVAVPVLRVGGELDAHLRRELGRVGRPRDGRALVRVRVRVRVRVGRQE
jgi:hypothetical protein